MEARSSIIAALITTAFASVAHAQYALMEADGSFRSIRQSGRIIMNHAEDTSADIEVPFSFPFFGEEVPAGSKVHVDSNGLLTIFEATTVYANTELPSSAAPSGLVAPFWDDLLNGAVYFEIQGTEPRRTLVVEWYDFEIYQQHALVRLQVRIQERSGLIELSYSGGQGGGGSASIGLEDRDGRVAVALPCTPTCQTTDVPEGRVITFTPQATADLTVSISGAVPSTLEPGESVTIDVHVENVGTTRTGSTSVAIFASTGATVSSSDLRIATATVGSLRSRESEDLRIELAVPASAPAGPRALAVIVDPDDRVLELDESNNAVGLGTVVFGGPLVVTLPREIVLGQGSKANYGLRAEGGHLPYVWAISGALPEGVSLEAGRLTGTPTKLESVTPTFTVTDSEGETASAEVAIRVSAPRSTTDPEAEDEGGGCSCSSTNEGRRSTVLSMLLLGLVFVALWRSEDRGR
ncbi:MAG: hypothetical protein HYV07_07030 [Deltaproteobacteria bacterium]|nr:hypothetical protein [Deltaproteobacteria bacterium]